MRRRSVGWWHGSECVRACVCLCVCGWVLVRRAGPSHWASLSDDYAACAAKSQSPINIDEDKATTKDMDSLKLTGYDKATSGHILKNNGHTGISARSSCSPAARGASSSSSSSLLFYNLSRGNRTKDLALASMARDNPPASSTASSRNAR